MLLAGQAQQPLRPSGAPDFSADQETVTLHFGAGALPVGSAQLVLTFTGELNDKMKGFYRSKYTAAEPTAAGGTVERFAAVSQFEATDARRCFPCWDEPAIKADFDIALTVPADRVALSNMAIVHEEPVGEHQRLVRFARTPVMSTYLVAFVVGEFDFVEDTSSDGVTVRVYTPVGKAEQGRFALDVAVRVLPFYKQYFDIAYPLPKLDLVAIGDFSAGAMENWGLVTYRETYLLVDPDNTSLIRKQSIALMVGHEIAHQWFGNLVTMEWWTHLWLNEGYASFVEFLCVDHLFPGFDIWTQFVTDMYTNALQLDCLRNSHPIEVPVGHPAEIDEIFDEISYNKGASVIRMLHAFIGDADFRSGMTVYLRRHQYANTQTEDLWRALEEASAKPVGAIMSTWIKQMGFPVVSVVSSEQRGTQRVLRLRQDKFTADGSRPAAGEEYFWMIPVTISRGRAPAMVARSVVLDRREMEIAVDDVEAAEWVKINPGTIGYYRTRYTAEMLEQLVPSVRDHTLPALDRLGLVDDLAALVQAGQAPTVEVLRLIEAYRTETNYTVWMSITACLVKLQTLLSHTTLEQRFNEFGVRLYKPIADRLGWDAKADESHLDTLLRSLVLLRLAAYDCPAFLAESRRRFRLHADGVEQLPADIRGACYKAVLKHGDAATLDEMLRLYRTTDLHEEKDRISRALGSMSDVALLRKAVDFAMSVSGMREPEANILCDLRIWVCLGGGTQARRRFRHRFGGGESDGTRHGLAILPGQCRQAVGAV